MRPVPIPDEIAAQVPGKRLVVGPPGMDLNTGIPPVEAMLSLVGASHALSVRCTLEADDLAKLTDGGHVWITFLGHMVPFDIVVGP